MDRLISADAMETKLGSQGFFGREGKYILYKKNNDCR